MRSKFVSLSAVTIVALTSAFACSSSPEALPASDGARDDAPVERIQSPVVNGSVDEDHEAVMAILSSSDDAGTELCSGTMVKVDAENHIGWILTAAHCVARDPMIVLQGPDYASVSAVRYLILDWAYDPRYAQDGDAGQRNDVAVLRVLGVDETTPVIPIASSPDGVAPGTSLLAIGYGRTSLIAAGDTDTNTLRRSVTLTVDEVDRELLTYDMRRQGICQGDSGGPDLVVTSDGERVVGVHSFVAGDCNGTGVSGRVTGNLAFIQGILDEPAPRRDCDLCRRVANSGRRECAQITDACLADEACASFYTCPGNSSSASGREACLRRYPRAEGPILATAACPCIQSCRDVCADDPSCEGVPSCGFTLPAGDCRSCGEGACCQQTIDCAEDADCYECLKRGGTVDDCAGGPRLKDLADCIATRCSSCAGTSFDLGGVPSGSRGDVSDPSDSSAGGCSASRGRTHGATGALAAFALGLGLAVARRRPRVC